MRTAYQGKYFEFLTKDMRKKPIETVDELEERKSIVFMEFIRVQPADGSAADLKNKYGDPGILEKCAKLQLSFIPKVSHIIFLPRQTFFYHKLDNPNRSKFKLI